ncbi:MAG: PaREP1 family protein [Thermoproteus sp.]
MDVYEAVERPLPKPTAEEYASARLLEALVESKLALEFLERGLVRNAAGKVFQAWRAVLAALLRLELDRLKAVAKDEEERKWLEEKAVPRVPTTRMVPLSLMLEALGYGDVSFITAVALDLHDYQYNGPDPDMALSKYRSRGEAARAVLSLVRAVARYAESLRARAKWTEEHEKALGELSTSLRETAKSLQPR